MKAQLATPAAGSPALRSATAVTAPQLASMIGNRATREALTGAHALPRSPPPSTLRVQLARSVGRAPSGHQSHPARTSSGEHGDAAIHAAATRGIATPWSALPYAGRIQHAFGRHDISSIQAHAGGTAAASATEMHADAYATGNHVVLGKGTDLFTVAHEAAHVVQQRAGVQLKGGVGAAGDQHERHADAVAARVSAGQSAEALLNAYTGQSAAGPQVQCRLAPGLPVNTEVVHHEPGGDIDGFKITKVPGKFGGYTIANNDGLQTYKNISTASIEWGTKADQAESRGVYDAEIARKQANAANDQQQKELDLGENYLSADYRRINPLLAAFERQGYQGAQVRNPSFDFSAKKPAVLATMKEIAIARKYTDTDGAESWDELDVDQTYAMLRAILNAWERFPAAGGGTHTRVFRGDSKFLYDSFPMLDPSRNNYKEGENLVSFSVTMPQILSTTYGDPKTHSYVKGKSLIWDISLPATHEGKGLGKNNQSEQEMSFPVGTTLLVIKVFVRMKDKMQRADTYGLDAEVIVMASIAEAPASTESSRRD
jgi:hypothetical protein